MTIQLRKGRARSPSAPSALERSKLPHDVPPWVGDQAIYFLTLCAQPRGVNQLCHPQIAQRILESIVYRHEQHQWWVHFCLLMPDHVHLLAGFPTDPGLTKVVTDWKRYVARQHGIAWQRDFFEHRIRQDESFGQKADYIRMNPVRAGLTADPDEWPYVWSWTRNMDYTNGALGERALPRNFDKI